MLKLTKRTEYGLIALVNLADKAAETPEGSKPSVVSARAIGEQFPMPPRLLAESLKALQAAGLVESTRGAQGGYRLARPAEEIHLGQIITALEGPPTLTACDSAASSAEEHSCEIESCCPIRSPLTRVRVNIWALMEGVTLRSLADQAVDSDFISTAS